MEQDTESLPNNCVGCGSPQSSCSCQELLRVFTKTNRSLAEMQLLDRLAGLTLTSLIQEQMTEYVHRKCRGEFDVSHLASLDHWLKTNVLSWLTRIYDDENDGERTTDDLVAHFKVKLSSYMYEKYASKIIEQFFNIIIGKYLFNVFLIFFFNFKYTCCPAVYGILLGAILLFV